MMTSEAVLRITPEGERREPTPAAARPTPESELQISADPLGMVPLTDLIAIWPDGTTRAARERRAQAWAAALPRSQRTKIGGRWLVSPIASMPIGLREWPTMVRHYLFVARGKVTSDLLGTHIPPGLAAQIPTWSEATRRRFFALCELIRRRAENLRECADLRAAERDLRFIAGNVELARRLGFKRVKTLPRIVDEARRKIEQGVPPDQRGRPRNGERGPRNPDNYDCDPGCWESFKSLWLTAHRRKVAVCWEMVSAQAKREGLVWPSLRTVQRRVANELPPSIADYYRRGPLYWDRHHAPKIRRDYSHIRPNQVWVGDEHLFDFLVLHNGRPIRAWLTAWEDMRSRKFVGWSIDPQANSDTILHALCGGIRAHGAPLELIIDNGKDYDSKAVSGTKRRLRRRRVDEERMTSICSRLEIDPHFCIPFNPGAKHVESAFRTVCERFSKAFDSYCGGSPEQRPEDLYRRLRRDQVDVPTLQRVRELFDSWVEDAYHNKPHTGDTMHGRTPNEVFATENPIPKRTAPAELLNWLLLKEVRRKVTRRGINLDGVYYGQGEVRTLELQGREVLVKIDAERADIVHVSNLEGRYLFTARNDRLDGSTLDHIRQSRKRIKAARNRVKQACAAHDRATRTVEEEALIAAQAEYHQQFAATGTDEGRPLQLLPTAGEVLDALPQRHGGHAREIEPAVDLLDLFEGTQPRSHAGGARSAGRRPVGPSILERVSARGRPARRAAASVIFRRG